MTGPQGQGGLYVSGCEARTPPDGAQSPPPSCGDRGFCDTVRRAPVRALAPSYSGLFSDFCERRGGGACRLGANLK